MTTSTFHEASNEASVSDIKEALKNLDPTTKELRRQARTKKVIKVGTMPAYYAGAAVGIGVVVGGIFGLIGLATKSLTE